MDYVERAVKVLKPRPRDTWYAQILATDGHEKIEIKSWGKSGTLLRENVGLEGIVSFNFINIFYRKIF